jgi:hypothetical protein
LKTVSASVEVSKPVQDKPVESRTAAEKPMVESKPVVTESKPAKESDKQPSSNENRPATSSIDD